jgi:hypothetical protein
VGNALDVCATYQSGIPRLTIGKYTTLAMLFKLNFICSRKYHGRCCMVGAIFFGHQGGGQLRPRK